MKKIISIILCAVLICVSLCGCSQGNKMTEKNVEYTVEAAVDALKEFDTENLKKYVKSTTLTIIISYAEKHDQFAQLGKAIFENLEYEITDINLQASTVTISVKNKDLYEVANAFASELKAKYSTPELMKSLGDERFLDNNLTKLTSKIALARMLDESTEITLNIRQGKDNLMLSFGNEAEDIISGGALNAVKQVFTAN